MGSFQDLPPEKRKKVMRTVIIAVVVSDMIIFGLIAYFMVLKPKTEPSTAPAPPAETRP
jgi:hypothetical protein